MALISLPEVFRAIIMTVAVGYILMDFLKPKKSPDEILTRKGFDWQGLWFTALLAAPALILHEFAHKFAAIALGINAEFFAAYIWLGIGLVLKLLGTGFIFFIPGYVSIAQGATPLQMSTIAFAGPFLNLLLFFAAWGVVKYKKNMSHKQYYFWYLTRNLNALLFVLNMLPIPPFDGFKVFSGLKSVFFA